MPLRSYGPGMPWMVYWWLSVDHAILWQIQATSTCRAFSNLYACYAQFSHWGWSIKAQNWNWLWKLWFPPVNPLGTLLLFLGVQLLKGKVYCVDQDTRNITNNSDCHICRSATAGYERWTTLITRLRLRFSCNVLSGWLGERHVWKTGWCGSGRTACLMLLFVIPFMITSFALIDMFIGAVVETFTSCQQGAVCWLPTAPSWKVKCREPGFTLYVIK